ncbi:MAG: aspartyl protease family protein [Oceanospirillaceae bacterium]
MKYILRTLLSLLAVTFYSSAHAEIYHYVNDAGRKIYVDRLFQVPAKYRQQIQKKTIVEPEISPREQQAYDTENAELARKMTARNAIAALRRIKKQLKTKVLIHQNKVVVPVNVLYAGKKTVVNLLLDTGASATVLHLATLPKFNQKNAKSSYAQVAGGGLIKTWLLSLDNLSFGPVNIDNKKVLMIENSGSSIIDGLLGMDILAATDYKIDFRAQHIIWNKEDYLKVEEQINALNLLLK